MSELKDFFANYSSFLQEYALAEDKKSYLEGLNHQNRKFFNLLLNPVSPKDEQLAVQLGLSSNGQRQLEKAKVFRQLKHLQNDVEKENLIQKILNLNPQLIATFQTANNAQGIPMNLFAARSLYQNQVKTDEKKENNVLKTENTVQEVVKRLLYQNPQNIAKITSYGYKNLTVEAFKKVDDKIIPGILRAQKQVIRSFTGEQLAELLGRYFTTLSITKPFAQQEQFPVQFYEIMTIEQIDVLKLRFPKLFNNFNFYQRNFTLKYQAKLSQYKSINQLTFQEQQDKKRLCLQILRQLEQEKSLFSFFYIQKITEEVLLLQEVLVDSNIERFISYLSKLRTVTYEHLNPDFKQTIKDVQGKNKFIDSYLQKLTFLESSRFNQTELINKTITCLFKKGQPNVLQRLSPYISKKHLIREQTKVKFGKGLQNEIANIYEALNTTQLNQLKELKFLSFSPRNKKVFTKNDRVQLTLTSKNIKQITVKIYEVDLQKHYLSSKSQIDQSINLKFLIPKCQPKLVVIDTEDPFVQESVNIELQELQEELGTFVVDLEGDQITSRAVIRKGMINVENVITPIGHELTFYDECGEPIPQLLLWRNGKKNNVKESYTIPFGTQATEEIIAVYKNYAQREVLSLVQENYTLLTDYIYNSETFIVGQKAKIVMRPQLWLHSQQISIQRITKATIKVSCLNNLKVPSTLTLENVKLKDNEDYIIQIPVKSYFQRIAIMLELQIERIDKTVQTIKEPKLIQIDVQESTNNFIDLYLNKCQKRLYKLQIKGLNGEAIPQTPAVFTYRQFGANHEFRQNLVSDNQGSFQLGTLPQVKTLTVAAFHNQIQTMRTWKINNLDQSISFGGEIYNSSCNLNLKQGQAFSFPTPYHFTPKDIVFYYYNSESQIYKNCLDELKIQDRYLSSSSLKSGKYVLILLRLEKRIEIEVLRGRKWMNGIIDKNNKVFEISNNQKSFISLGEITVASKEDYNQVDIDIITNKDEKPFDFRLHIFAKNYIDSQFLVDRRSNNVLQNLRQVGADKNPKQLAYKESSYLSNKRLSDETAYVLKRRKQPMKAGTNLEKPVMFLKKTEVGNTADLQEQLLPQVGYQNTSKISAQKPNDLLDFYGQHAQYTTSGSFAQQSQFGAFGQQQQQQSQNVNIANKLNTHNNFLSQVGFLCANANSSKGIKVPAGYSQIVVYLFADEFCIKREYSLPQAKLKTNNQAHSKLNDKDENVGWAICRQIHKLHPGKQLKINKNCLWNTVSKANVIEYAAALKVNLPDWLSNWNTYSEEKKLQVYDKEFSHQINFFLQKNDKVFFQRVVKPFLKNRLNKTLVDLYLIDSPQILAFATPHKISNLNYFQRALVVQALAKAGRQAEAIKLAESMTLPIKPLSKTNQTFKTFFQTILTAQKTSQTQTAPTGSAAFGGFKNMSNPGFGFGNMAPTNTFSNMSNVSNMGNTVFAMPPSASNVGFGFGNVANQNSGGMLSSMSNMMPMGNANFSGFGMAPNLASPNNLHSNLNVSNFGMDPFGASSAFASPSLMGQAYSQRPRAAVRSDTLQQAQQQYKAGYTSQKVREYCQTTYAGLKNQQYFSQVVQPSLFWAQLATHYSQKLDQTLFLSDKFNSFASKRDFILGISVLLSASNADYQLESSEDSFLISAKSSFLIFAKEIKACPIQQSKNLVINQRFFDNQNRNTLDQEGNQVENTVQNFVILKPYVLQTIVTNISGSYLQIQLLVDIPQGSIPLKNHNKTQIKNLSLNAYSTLTFEREFYFPGAGTFSVYPANASKNGTILCKSASIAAIKVEQKQIYVKSQRLEDILRSGTDQECFNYLREKNIFDSNVFNKGSILAKLKNRAFFEKCVQIFKQRNYFDEQIWVFSLYHKNFDLMIEYLESLRSTSGIMKNIQLPIFEYYPYYSNRVHSYVQQNRSNFKIKELRHSYASYLAHIVFYNGTNQEQSKVRLVFVYYLLLQDRIKEASEIRNKASKQEVETYQLQYDYIDCFIDVSLGAEKGFLSAKKISQLYLEYPVLAWRSLFTDVHKALLQNKSEELQETHKDQQTIFSATVTNNQTQIKIKQPANTTVLVHIYKLDLQLYFSEFPFSQVYQFSSIAPQKTLEFTSASFQVHTLSKKDYLELGDVIVQAFEQRQQSLPTKISTFLWVNPELRVKLFEKEGLLKVLYKNKKCQAYCKVYARGAKGIRFYKDGYTDIASTFRYAMNVDQIVEFSILVVTDFGGSIVKAKPPALQ